VVPLLVLLLAIGALVPRVTPTPVLQPATVNAAVTSSAEAARRTETEPRGMPEGYVGRRHQRPRAAQVEATPRLPILTGMRMGPHMMMPGDADAVKGARLERNSLRRAWHFAHPYRRTIFLFLTTIVLAALIELVPPFAFRRILDNAIPNKDRTAITVLAGIVVVSAIVDAGFAIVQRWCSATIGEGLIFDLRVALFSKVQRMPIAFFTRTQTGALTSRLNNDVIGAQTAVTSTLGSVVSNIVVLITTLIAMGLLEWRLTLLALIVLPIFIIPAKRVGKRLQAIQRENMSTNAEMNNQMAERFNVAGALLVKLFGRQHDEIDRFSGRARRVRDTGIQAAMYGRVFFVALGLVGALGAAAIYGVGAHLVVSGNISPGTLVALAALVTRVYQPLTGLTNARVDLMTAMVSFDRVFEVLDAPEFINDRPGAVDLVAPSGHLEFRDVWFRYPAAAEVTVRSLEAPSAIVGADPDRDVLQGVSLVVAPGETVALVGASGSGKTTLSGLIPRLYDVTGGAVLVDGHDVRDLTQHSLREAVGVVSQDPHLFHETIGQNLLYAKPDATTAELDAACRGARISDTIAALPDGYDTVVGERGYRLSGGEKQRLAIARLLLKNPAIMILDEATSHLDNENEAAVQAAFDEALQGRTAVIIAHRLSTIRDADRIVVLDDGRLVEQGSHDELMLLDGVYAAQVRAGESVLGA
jgi:ATP-binding cassette subfamily B protein